MFVALSIKPNNFSFKYKLTFIEKNAWMFFRNADLKAVHI